MKSVSGGFNTAFQQSAISVKPKVVVEFGNNRFNDDQTCSASSTKIVTRGITPSKKSNTFGFWSADDAFNNKNRNSMRWLVLDKGAKVDGTYRVIPSSYDQTDGPIFERGWWSANKSDSSGVFGSPEYVQSTWTTPRNINKIGLFTLEGYANMKSVTIQYLDASSVWHTVATSTLGVSTYYNEWTLASVAVKGLRVYVNSLWLRSLTNDNDSGGSNTSGADDDLSDYARISELQGYFIDDISADVISFSEAEDREEYVNTVPVGITRANTLSLELQNVDQKYSQENSSSIYYPYLTSNNKINLSVGVDTGGGVYEYVKQGEFFSDTWTTDGDTLNSRVECRDFSKYLQDEKILFFGKVWKNVTIGTVFKDILARMGKSPDEISIDSEATRNYEIVFLKDKIIWAFMAEIAFADQGMYGFDESGYFYYQSYNRLNESPYDSPVYTLSDSTNIVSAHQETELYVNSVIVKVSDYSLSNTTQKPLWSLSDPILSTLSFNYLSAQLGDSEVFSLHTFNDLDFSETRWPNSGYCYIGTEVIAYSSRDSNTLYGLTRGIGDTVPAIHLSGSYIGQAGYWQVDFDTPPAIDVGDLYVGPIDELEATVDDSPMATVVFYNKDAFGATFAIANISQAVTTLDGSIGSLLHPERTYNFKTFITGSVVKPGRFTQSYGGQPVGKSSSTGKWSKYIRRYGKQEIVVENPWIETLDHARVISDFLVDEYKNPRPIIGGKMIGYPALQLADRVTVSSYPELSISNKDFHTISLKYTYDGGLTADFMIRGVKVG